jgi:hypothetical protein
VDERDMSDANWSGPPEHTLAPEPADPAGVDAAQGATDTPAKPKGTPPWAWALMGVLALAIVAGGVWLAYRSGVAAGQRGATLPSETSTTIAAEVVTPTVVAIAPPDADTVDPGSADTVPAEESEPPAGDPPVGSGRSTVTKGYDLSLVKPLDLQPVAPQIPTTWKVIFNHSSTGPWEMPNPPSTRLSCT